MATTQIIDGHFYITTGSVSGSRTLSISTIDGDDNAGGSITSIDGDATTISITTSSAHRLIAGNTVVITDTTSYNGSYTVATAPTTTTLTITDASHNLAAESSGKIQHTPTSIPSIIVTSSGHGLLAGETISITGTTNYNSSFVVGRIDSTSQFTIFEQGYNFASESSGTITRSGGYITHNINELVDIWATKIDFNYDNAIQLIAPVVSGGNVGSTKPTKTIDLKRITFSLNISGYLIDESGNSAKLKRDNLIALASLQGVDDAKSKRVMLVVWGTNNAANEQTIWDPNSTLGGAFIQKIMFSETGGYVGEAVSTTADVNPPERQIGITIQLIRGKVV